MMIDRVNADPRMAGRLEAAGAGARPPVMTHTTILTTNVSGGLVVATATTPTGFVVGGSTPPRRDPA